MTFEHGRAYIAESRRQRRVSKAVACAVVFGASIGAWAGIFAACMHLLP
jgi:hypothetical protein